MIKFNIRLIILLCSVAIMPVTTQAGFSIGGFSLGKSGDGEKEVDVGKMFDTIKEGKRAFGKISKKKEIEFGKQAASVILGAAPLSGNDALQQYVNKIGHWLVDHTERKDLPWKFGVLETNSVNAFAAPGGYIFITQGLIDKLDNEAELACVLAHEIAHVLRRHHLLAVKKNARFKMTTNMVSLAAKGKDQKSVDKVVGGVKELYARGLDKNDEFEADHMGMVIAARSGYDPYALMAVLHTLDSVNPDDRAMALWFKTHPKPAKRLEKLDETIKEKLEKYAEQALGQDRFHTLSTATFTRN